MTAEPPGGHADGAAPPTDALPPWLSAHQPTIMAVVNVNADSFSDPRAATDADERLAAARAAVADGATVVDLGAQSAALDADLVPLDDQVAALTPLVAALHADGVAVSVDTHERVVAGAVLQAGATILNDFSGELDPAIVEVVADTGAWYVLTHNPLGFRRRQTDPNYYDDVVAEVVVFVHGAVDDLTSRGVSADRILVDPGVDAGKTPAQTLDLLRARHRIRTEIDQPLLWAISRKDVLGAITHQPPADRDAATLGLLAALADHPRTLVRVHAVAAARDLLAVHAALAGRMELGPGLLDDNLRRQPE